MLDILSILNIKENIQNKYNLLYTPVHRVAIPKVEGTN